MNSKITSNYFRIVSLSAIQQSVNEVVQTESSKFVDYSVKETKWVIVSMMNKQLK